MEASQSDVFTLLFILWGFITVVLIALLSYRATLLKESVESSVDGAELRRLREEQAFIVRRARLTGEIIALSVISGALLLTSVGFSIFFKGHGIF